MNNPWPLCAAAKPAIALWLIDTPRTGGERAAALRSGGYGRWR